MKDEVLPHSTGKGVIPLKNIIAVGDKRIIVIDDEIASKLRLTDATIIEQHITDKGIFMKIRNQRDLSTGLKHGHQDTLENVPTHTRAQRESVYVGEKT